jgi:hypothetical protein
MELLDLAEPSFRQFADQHGYALSLHRGPLVRPRADVWLSIPIIRALQRSYTAAARWLLRTGSLQSGRQPTLRDKLADGDLIFKRALQLFDIKLQRFWPRPRPAAWTKIKLVRALLKDYDAVFWIDADAMITDSSTDVASVVVPGKWLYLAQHQNEHHGDHLNTGVFLILRCNESERFLDEVWNQADLTYHMWWEQAAVLRILGYDLHPARKARPSKYGSGVEVIGAEWNSSPPNLLREARIKHYAGMSHEERLLLMKEDLIQLGLG